MRSGWTATRPWRSTSAPVALPRASASGEACTPAAQMTVAAVIRSSPSGPDRVAPKASMSVTRHPIRSSTPILVESGSSTVGEVVAEVGERLLSSVRQHHADVRRVDRAELVAKAAHRELADLAGELDPGRSGADHHHGREYRRASSVVAVSATSKAP